MAIKMINQLKKKKTIHVKVKDARTNAQESNQDIAVIIVPMEDLMEVNAKR